MRCLVPLLPTGAAQSGMFSAEHHTLELSRHTQQRARAGQTSLMLTCKSITSGLVGMPSGTGSHVAYRRWKGSGIWPCPCQSGSWRLRCRVAKVLYCMRLMMVLGP